MSSPETSPRGVSPKQQSPRLSRTASTDSTTPTAAAALSSGSVKGILKASSISTRPSSANSTSSRSPRGDRRGSRRSLSSTTSRETAVGTEKLTFADQHGSKLDENHFVEHLHYSDASVDMPGQLPSRSCCVIT